MLGKWLPKTTLILPALCLAAAPVFAQNPSGSAQQTGDPVADAARKAKEDKKTAPKPKKVYTEDDLPKAPRGSDQTPAPAPQAQGQGAAAGQTAQGEVARPAGAAKAAGAAAAAAPEEQDAESLWRGRFKAMRDKIARAEKELDILQRESEKAQTQYYSDPQKALAEQNNRKEINEKNAKIAAKKQELEGYKQELSDLEDQLRKSGGDSGWARQ